MNNVGVARCSFLSRIRPSKPNNKQEGDTMRHRSKLSKIFTISALASGLLLAGCGDDGKDGKDAQSNVGSTTSGFVIPESAIFVAQDAADGENITEALSLALFEAPEDALVVLPQGRFDVTESIVVNSARGLTVAGHGMNETILDFSTSNGDDAFRFQGGNGITVRDLAVYEAPKNGIKTTNVNGIHITNTAKNNVAGIEIENSSMADVYNNIAVGNSG